jgi:hypothetical protein
MMKLKKAACSFFIFVLIGLNTTAIAGEREKTETRNVKKFDAIEVSAGIDLFVSMGNRESVKVVADDEIIDNVKTEVRGGTLHVYMKESNWLRSIFNWGSPQSRKVYVTVNELKRLRASSGSDAQSENTLKGDRLEIEASSGSDVKLDVVYKEVTLNSSSGSDARLSGRTKFFTASASSGSDINARELQAQICKVSASSGSDASVSVTEELNANASSGADVVYFGNPAVKNIDESSGGDVSGR